MHVIQWCYLKYMYMLMLKSCFGMPHLIQQVLTCNAGTYMYDKDYGSSIPLHMFIYSGPGLLSEVILHILGLRENFHLSVLLICKISQSFKIIFNPWENTCFSNAIFS